MANLIGIIYGFSQTLLQPQIQPLTRLNQTKPDLTLHLPYHQMKQLTQTRNLKNIDQNRA